MIIVIKVVTEVNQNPKVRKAEIEVANHARVQNRNQIQKMNQKPKMIKKMRKIRMKIINKIMKQNRTRKKRTNPMKKIIKSKMTKKNIENYLKEKKYVIQIPKMKKVRTKKKYHG